MKYLSNLRKTLSVLMRTFFSHHRLSFRLSYSTNNNNNTTLLFQCFPTTSHRVEGPRASLSITTTFSSRSRCIILVNKVTSSITTTTAAVENHLAILRRCAIITMEKLLKTWNLNSIRRTFSSQAHLHAPMTMMTMWSLMDAILIFIFPN